ncbi:MAG: thiamine pyrophosphate-dependent dehydrogenase E1 component subunit alpha [Candidatus Heimdallarchaeota archaeon]
MEIERDTLLHMLRKMLEVRLFEEKAYELFGQDLVPGTLHLYLGQEAVAVGVCENLRNEDLIQSTHRGHGHCIAKGARMDKTLAEILGKVTGYCKGKGGSMHVTDFSKGILGACGVVGAGLPLAVGAALSVKLRKSNQVVTCFFGDGASNQGTFHESLNMAALWKLPVVFVCENNLYAMGTRISKATTIKDIVIRASGYGMPGVIVDGNDVIDTYKAARDAIARARNGEGPTLIEAKTYRYKGHSRFDPAKYRPEGELKAWLEKDPIERMKRFLIEEKILSEPEYKQMREEIIEIVEAAAKFAIESPLPPPEETLAGVFARK